MFKLFCSSGCLILIHLRLILFEIPSCFIHVSLSNRGMSFVRTVKLRVLAGVAKPGPSIGQALGPLGINMMEFCKVFIINWDFSFMVM